MIKRYKFKFYASVTQEVEFPDDCVEGSDEYEAILDSVAQNIDVDKYAEVDDVVEAE